MKAITQWPDYVEFVDSNNADSADFADGHLPETQFPHEQLPGVLKDCVEDCVRVYGVEPDLAAIIGLSVLSAAMGKGLVMRVRQYRVRGNLFALASAPSGAGKSSCFRPFVHPLQGIEEHLTLGHADRLPELEAERELLEAEAVKLKRGKGEVEDKKARLAAIKARLQELDTLCRPPQLIAENATIEALGVLLEANGEAMALLSPDGSEVISNWLGRYNKTDRTDEGLLLKAWTGEPCRINRLSRKPVCLKEPCLSLLLCCTPDEITHLFGNERFVTGGLMPRFLVCESRSRPKERNGQSQGLDGGCWSRWNRLVVDLYRAFYTDGNGGLVNLTPASETVFDEAHNAYCRSFDLRPEGDSFEARRAEQAMRIALCLHAVIHGDELCRHPLKPDTATAALALAQYFGQTATRMQALAAQLRDTAMIERIEETARKHGTMNPDGLDVSVRELTRRNGIEPGTLRALALRNPDTLELLRITNTGKRGRPSEVLRLKSVFP